MKRICVFCGANSGARLDYAKAAQKLGEAIVSKGFGLVYGGANVGLMRVVADTVLSKGGDVIGIIPENLVVKEIAHEGLQDLRVVPSMHERKAQMEKLSDGFVALPGGFGTFEELCEILTWSQLGLHHKPCGVLNVNGYFNRFLGFLDHAVDEKFIRPEHRELLLSEHEPDVLLQKFQDYVPLPKSKWIKDITQT
jgi:uncharacterized protein (TIGR00730 family)